MACSAEPRVFTVLGTRAQHAGGGPPAKRIAKVRKQSVALQRGLQANIEFTDDTAAFYRVYQDEGIRQTALVLLNKGDNAREFPVMRWLSTGTWRDAVTGEEFRVRNDDQSLVATVAAHSVRVLLFDEAVNNVRLMRELDRLQEAAERSP